MSGAINFVPETISSGGKQDTTLNASTGGKRPRRMRSERGASHFGNGHTEKKGGSAARKVEYHDRKVAAPMFLQKTYEMINTCDPALATWTDDGKMFVIKDQDTFAKDVIPQFFDHKKFTSFARQLNFYGFRKMQSKALYKDQTDFEVTKHVTFLNEKFQRGKPELLKEISRSTKGGQPNSNQEIVTLKRRVQQLENDMNVMKNDYEARFSQLEAHMYNLISYSNGQPPNAPSMPPLTNQMYPEAVALNQTQDVKINPSTSGDGTAVSASMEGQDSEPTLPAHPNSKVLPEGTAIPPPPLMRNISLLRGWSNGSFTNVDATPQLPPFEEKYFLNLMNNNSNNPHERLPNQAALTRQMSQGFQKLDINNIEEYPPLGEPM